MDSIMKDAGLPATMASTRTLSRWLPVLSRQTHGCLGLTGHAIGGLLDDHVAQFNL